MYSYLCPFYKVTAFVVLLLSILGLSKPSFANNQGLRCLVEAYPSVISPQTALEGNTLLWRDGTVMPYDDGESPSSFQELLDNADLKDQMSMPYPLGALTTPPRFNFDPGRVRNEEFFAKLYGSSEAEVRRQLTRVYWAPSGTYVMFSQNAGAANALAAVGKQIAAQADLVNYVSSSLGTFNWRNIQGSDRKSNHSFGIAIDFKLPAALHKYWLWGGCKPEKPCPYSSSVLNDRILPRIVTIFEAHGFIWGGKWHHYDTMHFEYRPELTHPACSTH